MCSRLLGPCRGLVSGGWWNGCRARIVAGRITPAGYGYTDWAACSLDEVERAAEGGDETATEALREWEMESQAMKQVECAGCLERDLAVVNGFMGLETGAFFVS